MVSCRCETEWDTPAIRELVIAAFGRADEADLIEIIRHSANFIPELSLVVTHQGEVLAHLLFSLIQIETADQRVPALALAPMAVLPEYQRQGFGSRLMEFGLGRCRELGHKIVIVLGHPEYYPRFGFQCASQFGIECGFPVPDEAFFALELVPGGLDGVKGTVCYPSYFWGV